MTVPARKPFYKVLYVQVLFAILVGIVLGYAYPDTGAAMRPLGDGFIKLVRMMITPIIFCVVVVGIAKIGDLKAVGRIGVKALVYFEVVSTLALIIGLVVVNVLKPGVGTPYRGDRPVHACALPHDQHDDARRTDRSIRGDGIHDRVFRN
jgi:aerobic C4-dicarboxylate transport protein